MQTFTYISGGILGLLSIVFGAFGSHALKKVWTKEVLESFEIGVKYQMYHALFLILLGSTLNFECTYSSLSVYFCLAGVLLFSGSIYGICYFKSRNHSVKFLGPITPLGGLCLILSWLYFMIALI